MPKFAANLTMLFNEVEFLDRFEKAAQHGFRAVEFLFPYDFSPEVLQQKLTQYQLQLVLHNLPAGNWEAGDRGLASDPDRREEFTAGVAKAIAYAKALGVPQLNCLAGRQREGVSHALARQTLVENLRYAASALQREQIRLLIEPINTFDIPGFFLHSTRAALELINDVGSDNLFIQYDIYHMQRMEGELANTLRHHLPRIAHIQIADNPGRHEPGTGEINFPFLFEHLDALGYTGWVGCEYKPLHDTASGLGWRPSA